MSTTLLFYLCQAEYYYTAYQAYIHKYEVYVNVPLFAKK